MAQQKIKGITREQKWKIWQTIGPNNWLDFLKSLRPDARFIRVNNGQFRGLCPCEGHDEEEPSFNVYVSKGYVKCYGCGFYTADPLVLVQLAGNFTSVSEATHVLHSKFKFPFLGKKEISELEAQRRNQALKQVIDATCRQVLLDALENPTKYPYARITLDWLLKDRKIPLKALGILPIGIMPPLGELSDMIDTQFQLDHQRWVANDHQGNAPENFAAAATEYLAPYMSDPAFVGAVVLPLHVTPTEIGRLKLRVPLTGSEKKFITPQDDYEENFGLYGVGWEPYQELLAPEGKAEDKLDTVLLTEGEFDVISYMARVYKEGPTTMLLSVGGRSGAPHIQNILGSFGIKNAYLIGDAPDKKGDTLVLEWLTHLKSIKPKVFVGWKDLAPSGDLDEAILQHGIEHMRDVLEKNLTDNFLYAWEWVADYAERDLETCDHDDVRQLTEIAADYGKHIQNRTDLTSYITRTVARYPVINEAQLQRDITAQSDNEVGFILSCSTVLSKLLYCVGTQHSAAQRTLILQERTSKQIHTIRLDSEQSIAQELAPIMGTLVNFVDTHIGFPHFIQNPITSDGLTYIAADRKLRFLLKEAVLNMAQGTPDIDTAPKLRQGYHHTVNPAGEKAEYIVCGNDIFNLIRTDKGLEYKLLEGPSHNGIVFDTGLTKGTREDPWYPGGLTSEILEEGKQVDIKQLYKDLTRYYTKGFTFKHQSLIPKLLAALVLVFPIMAIFPRQLLLFLTGETSSGKSNVLCSFTGLGSDPALRLLHLSRGMDWYTAAGVRNMTKSDTRLLALDEFEFTDKDKTSKIEAIMEWVRGLISSDSKSVMARSDGSYEVSSHKLPIMFSAITGADKPQDLNRLLIVEMKKVEGRQSPSEILLKEFGVDGIAAMAKKVSVAMYPHAPTLLGYYNELATDITQLQALAPIPLEHRYASSFFGILALMRLVGEDWKDFFQQYIVQHSGTIRRANTISESQLIVNQMLYHQTIPQPETKTLCSLAQLLISDGQREQINASGHGVFYDEKTNLLLMLAEQVIPKLMPDFHKSNLTGTRLKDTLDRHPDALVAAEITRSGILRRVTPYLGAGITVQDVVVFRVTSRLTGEQPAPLKGQADDTPVTADTADADPGANIEW